MPIAEWSESRHPEHPCIEVDRLAHVAGEHEDMREPSRTGALHLSTERRPRSPGPTGVKPNSLFSLGDVFGATATSTIPVVVVEPEAVHSTPAGGSSLGSPSPAGAWQSGRCRPRTRRTTCTAASCAGLRRPWSKCARSRACRARAPCPSARRQVRPRNRALPPPTYPARQNEGGPGNGRRFPRPPFRLDVSLDRGHRWSSRFCFCTDHRSAACEFSPFSVLQYHAGEVRAPQMGMWPAMRLDMHPCATTVSTVILMFCPG